MGLGNVFCRDDQIILNGIIFYMASMLMDASKNLPLWRTDGAVLMALFHMGPVEFLYYWLHRALHHHFLYSRYHSHHHSSIATEPITCKTALLFHFFAYHFFYLFLWKVLKVHAHRSAFQFPVTLEFVWWGQWLHHSVYCTAVRLHSLSGGSYESDGQIM